MKAMEIRQPYEIERIVGEAMSAIEIRVEQDKILFGDENENPDFWVGRNRGFEDCQILVETIFGIAPPPKLGDYKVGPDG